LNYSDYYAVDWALAVFVVAGLFVWLMNRDAARFLTGASRKPGPPAPGTPAASNEWNLLVERAGNTVQAAIAELPDDVRAEAEAVPVLFEERSERDGDGKVILGIYRGFTEGRVSARKGPIVLYLRTIEEIAGRLAGGFEDQVRRTFLHELGHHLGWGEADVRARGL
jgi:predicted Zn-dependent protease with MMP-like domain